MRPAHLPSHIAGTRTRRATAAARFRLLRIAADADAAIVLRLVAGTTLVPPEDLVDRSRGTAHAAFARQLVMYLLHVVHSRSYHQIGALIGRDPGTVAHACAVIEGRRDRADFETFVSALEARLAPSEIAGEEARYA